MPESDLPDIDATVLSELLEAVCMGKRGVAEVRQVALIPFLRGRLSHSQDRFLEEHAPETITVPSGNRARLTYEPDRPPVMAVRLQELFGWAETPRVAMGRVPIVLHLLGPNFRPVQITDDLRSFWATTYFQVRKDLRARYPKHAWPEDPKNRNGPGQGSKPAEMSEWTGGSLDHARRLNASAFRRAPGTRLPRPAHRPGTRRTSSPWFEA